MHSSDSNLQEKNNEILHLLNQIATDMIRESDVDRLVAEAVAKVTADYEERMKSMAAEYEARIAEIQVAKTHVAYRKSMLLTKDQRPTFYSYIIDHYA